MNSQIFNSCSILGQMRQVTGQSELNAKAVEKIRNLEHSQEMARIATADIGGHDPRI